MTLGKRLLLYSDQDPSTNDLARATAEWGCLTSHCGSVDELRGRLEGDQFDVVVVEPSAVLQQLVAATDPAEILQLPLAEIEKRHIHRVLASTGGNKTRAARILGIDTKTLYNKLKSYQSAEAVARRRITSSSASSA